MKQIRAIRALRWNYRRKGVWFWLKGRKQRRCTLCEGAGTVHRRTFGIPAWALNQPCPRCEATGLETTKIRGYQRILSEPETVIAEQKAMAEGVFG